MKWVCGLFGIVFVLYGCAEQQEEGVQVEAGLSTVEIMIPAELAQHYGSLNIEYIASNIQKTIQPDGIVSLKMNEQQLEEIAQQSAQFLEQYKETGKKSANDGIAQIVSDESYSDWEIVIADKTILEQEAFDLAQEHLIKNILTYQLVHRHLPELHIQYVSHSGEKLDEKIIRTRFAYSDE